MRSQLILLLLTLICCEFSDENLQGPPETPESKSKKTDDKDSDQKQFVASIEDRDGATAIRIESAPDLTNEREQAKGRSRSLSNFGFSTLYKFQVKSLTMKSLKRWILKSFKP